MAKKINIFIPHIHEDDEKIAGLKNLLEKRGYEVKDSSIDTSNPNNATNEQHIKSNILAPAINWASTILVIISPETHKSWWVNWEIEFARLHANGDKRIIGVWDQGARDSDLPESLDEYGNALVGWNGDSIVAAIEGDDRSTTATGKLRPERTIVRHNC